MNTVVSDFLEDALLKLQAGGEFSGLHPVLSQGSSDFSIALSDFQETPASLGAKIAGLLPGLPGVARISVRPPMADVMLTPEWRNKWLIEGRIVSSQRVVRHWELPFSLAEALQNSADFDESNWGQMGAEAILAANLPVKDHSKTIMAAFQLATWEAPAANFQDLSAGRFFSGQSNLAFKWLRSYFRAKSILKRQDQYLGILPESRGDEEINLTKALLQVPLCLSRAQDTKSAALLPAVFHLIQQAFTRLWVAKPLESPGHLPETAYRFALLRRFVESCEALCDAAGIGLRELGEPGRG